MPSIPASVYIKVAHLRKLRACVESALEQEGPLSLWMACSLHTEIHTVLCTHAERTTKVHPSRSGTFSSPRSFYAITSHLVLTTHDAPRKFNWSL